MTELQRIEEIRQRLATNAYFLNPHSDVNVREDIAYLVSQLEQRESKIADLEKKNKVLANHALELTQEIENVKSDFGGDQR